MHKVFCTLYGSTYLPGSIMLHYPIIDKIFVCSSYIESQLWDIRPLSLSAHPVSPSRAALNPCSCKLVGCLAGIPFRPIKPFSSNLVHWALLTQTCRFLTGIPFRPTEPSSSSCIEPWLMQAYRWTLLKLTHAKLVDGYWWTFVHASFMQAYRFFTSIPFRPINPFSSNLVHRTLLMQACPLIPNVPIALYSSDLSSRNSQGRKER